MRSAVATYSPLHARVYRGADAWPPLMPSAGLSRWRGAPSEGAHQAREATVRVCGAHTARLLRAQRAAARTEPRPHSAITVQQRVMSIELM